MKLTQRIYHAALLLLFLLLTSAPTFADDTIVFVVNSKNPATKLSAQEIADLFFKKKREWGNGSPVRFFDRPDDTAERKQFLSSILKKTGREIELYWIGQKLYSGNSAPVQLTTDALTVSLVSKFAGAIGYVSSSFSNLKDVKKVEVTGIE